jgi:hypothetical protein
MARLGSTDPNQRKGGIAYLVGLIAEGCAEPLRENLLAQVLPHEELPPFHVTPDNGLIHPLMMHRDTATTLPATNGWSISKQRRNT